MSGNRRDTIDIAGPALERRGFLGACAAATVAGPLHAASGGSEAGSLVQPYQRSRLVHATGEPVRSADLAEGACFVFNYPFVATPCFLINLGGPAVQLESLQTEDGRAYVWQGGSGRDSAIVAYCAICSHKLSHPAKSVSFINYRHERVRFRSADREDVVGQNLIYCCSDKSVFDPTKGARVVGGPAKQPLASILLDHDADDDTLTAVGTYGGDKFNAFFEKFGPRLALERSESDIRAKVADTTLAVPIEKFSARQMRCGAV